MKIQNIITYLSIIFIVAACQNKEVNQENDAEFTSIKKVYTLNTDGSVNYQYSHELNYISHLAFNRLYGESFIVYHPEKQELKFNQVKTKMANGKIIHAPKNAFNEVLPRFAAGAPDFNSLREMVVTHTGLETGCKVFFDYELKSKPDYLPFLNENIVLQEIVPVNKLEIVVKVPENIKLSYKLLNANAKFKTTKKEGYTIYSWKIKELEALARENNQPHSKDFLPRLLLSNVSMKEALNAISNQSNLSLNDDIKKAITKKTSEKTKIEQIHELQILLDKEMNAFKIPLKHTSYTTRSLENVWNSNGATELEKTMLLNEMLKHLNFKSELVYCCDKSYFDKELGNLNETGKFFVMTELNNEKTILSTSPHQNNNLAFLLKNQVILTMNAEELSVQHAEKEIMASLKVKGHFVLDNNGKIKGKAEIAVEGLNNPRFSNLLDENNKTIMLSVFPKNSIKTNKLIYSEAIKSKAEAEIEKTNVWKNTANYYFMSIPESSLGIQSEHLEILLENRTTPLQLNQDINEIYEFNITLPEGFVLSMPFDEKLENTLGKVYVSVKQEGQNLQIQKELLIKKSTILPEEYQYFRSLLNLWNKKMHKEIVLKK